MSTEVHAHHEHPDVVGSRNRLGVILILVADIAFALAVLFTFFYLKGQNVNGMWLPKANGDQKAVEAVAMSQGWKVTFLAVCGLLGQRWALLGGRHGRHSGMMIGGGFALVFSVAALWLQIHQISQAPFTTQDGAYASCYFLITGLNAVHLVITVFIAFGNLNRTRLGLYDQNYWHVDIVEVWWIWMTVSSALGAFALSLA